jgi:DNA-binding PadR family transcriptional regulator
MQRHFERLNPLQIVLLVFVKFGLTTPYDLLSKAGMGVGMTSPALKRLEEAGLLTCTPGPRNRMRYALTDKGADELKESLEAGPARYLRHGGSATFAYLPRAIILAWVYSGVEAALRLVSLAQEELRFLGEKKEREAVDLRNSMLRLQADLSKDDPAADKGILIATTYRWIEAESEVVLFKLQAEAIRTIAPLIAGLPPAPQVRRDEERVW